MKSGIYKITNEVTGKFYIGSAKDIDWRWYEHKRDLRLKSHCNPKLQHSWDYYGEDKFTFMLLEEVEPEQQKLFEREQYYLDTFRPYLRNIGYNICPTAEGGDNITHNPNREAFIEKMSEICSGEGNAMFGRNHSRESIDKQRKKAEGRFTLEWFIKRNGETVGKKKYEKRRKMLANRKITYSVPCLRKGKSTQPMSEAAKRKISESKHRLKTSLPNLLEDIRSDQFSIKILSEKYRLGMTSIKNYKRKIKQGLL